MTHATQTLVSEVETDTTVSSIVEVASDVVEVTLTPVAGEQLPGWTPGAHVDLLLGEDLVRQYSLCSSPGEGGHYRVAVLKTPDSRGGSQAVHQLQVGSALRIRGPRNHFPLVAAPAYIFVAGGIGITPMLPMIEQATAAGAEWHLYYGGRSRSSMAYLDRLKDHGDRVTAVPQDDEGMLDLDSILGTPRPGTLVYCCGPEPLLAAVEERCESWPPGALHLERFTAKAVDTSNDDTFELALQRSGITVTVGPQESVFDAMRAAGVAVLGSCLEGICGTCETGVLEGEVDHRDSVLDPEEQEANDCMMVCVSRARSARLVLDA
ncbi:MAG: PDR/VanB family oxidoreductase [Actinomycetales bacterium]